MTRCKIVVNPAAGKGAAGRQVDRLTGLLRERGLDCSLELTGRPWHAAEIARTAALQGFAVIAAAGGDGTCNEVINGLMAAQSENAESPAFAVLPIGRGNDLAFGLGVPAGLEASVAAIGGGRLRPFDVGRVRGGDYPEGRYFGNGVGIGFDTLVGLEAARMKRITGAAAYACAAIKLLAIYSAAPLVRLRLDGREIVGRMTMVSLMNGRRMGGAFHMAPGAATDDGMLDVCAAARTGRLRMIGLFVRYVRGTQARSRLVTVARTGRVTVEALDGGLAVHADGETICTGGSAIEAECLPRRLSAIAASV